MAVQGSMNASLGKLVGTWNAVFLASFTGVVLVMAVSAPGLPRLISQLGRIPVYLFLAGPLVVAITYLVVLTVPSLGMANATTAILLGQLGAAFVLDHLGAFGLERHPFQWANLLGIVALAVGARILLTN